MGPVLRTPCRHPRERGSEETTIRNGGQYGSFPGESRGPSLRGTSGGRVGPGFRRDSAPHMFHYLAGRRRRWRTVRKLVQIPNCRSGTGRRAGPGTYEHLFCQCVRRPVFMVSGLTGSRPRPGMTPFFRFRDSLESGGIGPALRFQAPGFPLFAGMTAAKNFRSNPKAERQACSANTS
jgi:hypothetical protein